MSEPADFRWDDLKLFLAAYRTRSLTQAAARLSLNQSTLSRRLTGFEEALGARLFDRTPEGLQPTELAERLLEPAERAEAASHDVARWGARADREVDGEVRIAVAEGVAYYILAPALPRLLERHPKLRVSLAVSVESADLTRREADIAIRFYRPSRGDLIAKRIWRGDYGVYAAPALAERLGEGPHALEGLPFVCWGEEQTGFPEGRWEREAGVDPIARADVMTTRLALAQAGVGAIELTRDWGRSLPGLVEIETEPTGLGAEVWLVTHRTLREVPRVRAVWDWIAEQITRVVDHVP